MKREQIFSQSRSWKALINRHKEQGKNRQNEWSVINSSIVRGQCWDHDHLIIPFATGKRFSVGWLGMVAVQEPGLITIQPSRNLLHLRQIPLLCWKWWAVGLLNQLISLYADRAPPRLFMAKGYTPYRGMIRGPQLENRQ